MASLFANLRFDRIIVHEILLASELEAGRVPKESDEFLELPPQGLTLLSKRFVDSMGSESHSIALDVEDAAEGSTFDLLTQLIGASDADFVANTKELARKLTRAQTAGTIKGGIAVFVEGSMGEKKSLQNFVAVLKAESDSGFQKRTTTDAVLLQFVSDLVLGAQQRLFKIGCFVENRGVRRRSGLRDRNDFEAFVYDHLLSNTGSTNAARYFYGTFLGCRFAENAPRLTRIFYEKTTEFINRLKIPSQNKVESKTHLVSYLKSSQSTISPREFAERYLEPKLRDGYLQWVYRGDALPKRDITKDNAQINRKLQVRRILFSSKVRVSAPAEGFDKVVQVLETSDGWTTLRVEGEIETQT